MAADHKRVWNICTCHQNFCHYNEILLTVADLEHELDQDLEHDLDQETYVEENPQKYELVDEETAKKRQRMQQFRSKDKPLLSSEPDSDSDSVVVKVNQNNFNSLGSFHFFTFQVPCIVSFAHFQNCWLLENLLIPLLFNGVIKLSHSCT